jgi:threonine/homoserine/homoserine lactone efflux protein
VARFIVDPAARAAQGQALLFQRLVSESTVLAYDDLFQVIAAISGAMFLWLALVAWRAARANPAPATARSLNTSANEKN